MPDFVCLGQKKLFHVKEYLSPKELKEKGLIPILDAMEVADYTHPGMKKKLLRYLYPNCSIEIELLFKKYIKDRGSLDWKCHRSESEFEYHAQPLQICIKNVLSI